MDHSDRMWALGKADLKLFQMKLQQLQQNAVRDGVFLPTFHRQHVSLSFESVCLRQGFGLLQIRKHNYPRVCDGHRGFDARHRLGDSHAQQQLAMCKDTLPDNPVR